jgi:hypothetical protein
LSPCLWNDELANLKTLIAEKTKDVRLKEDNLNELIEEFARMDRDEFFYLIDFKNERLILIVSGQ